MIIGLGDGVRLLVSRLPDETLVSVIVPAWNAAITLERTLRSAARQTHRNLEILIVDDGSTDDTAEIGRRFCESDNRGRLISGGNKGVATARNRGIDEAKGAWIAPLDSDDLWHPRKIERQLATFADRPPSVGLVYCWYRTIDEHDRIVSAHDRPTLEGRIFDRHLEFNFVGSGSIPLIRRSALGHLRYDPMLRALGREGCEDWLLQLAIARDHEFACTPEFLMGYRMSAGAMSANSVRMMRSQIAMYRILLKNDPKRLRKVVRRQLARWRVARGLSKLRRGALSPGAGYLASAFCAAPVAAGVETARHISNRYEWWRGIPEAGQSFLQPGAAQDRAAIGMA